MEEKQTVALPRPRPQALQKPQPYLQILSGSLAGKLLVLGEHEVLLGRDSSCQLILDLPGISRKHARIVKTTEGYQLEDLGSTNGTFIEGQEVFQPQLLKTEDRILLGDSVTIQYGEKKPEELDLIQRLFQGATRDALTGTHNRGSFFELLKQEHALSCRQANVTQPQGGRYSVVMLDVDHFKKVNDVHGHAAGDAVLRRLAECVSQNLRTEDVLGRYGGEEFAVLLRGIDLVGAQQTAERIRSAIEGTPVKAPTTAGIIELNITASFGVAQWNQSETPEECIARADAALYRSKHEGRNRVTASS